MPKTKSHIYESQEIRSILSTIAFDTALVLFDLDNTVMWPGTYLGSDDWFQQLFTYLSPHIDDKTALTTLAVAIYNEAQQHSKAVAVEEGVITLIHCLQSIGYPVIAITARGESIKEATLEQLASLNLDFDHVIFCSGQNKGTKLTQWLNETPAYMSKKEILFAHDFFKQPIMARAELKQNQFSKVTMVDDKKKHLLSVKQALKRLNYSLNGVRYGKMDHFFGKEDNNDKLHQTLKHFSHFSDKTNEKLMPIMNKYESTRQNRC